ncbi:MAG: hypothetical protein K9M55_00270 [Candidatus Marinimicrobia bacterium]|nr:hypothetical protein [Candidatus Neomarinimicrobiota bacterium]MCF7921111.1 hypothetical protein [Candidatus Neomarinimicrobiota bacterium]
MKHCHLRILLLLLVGSVTLQAHHAMEFIELESYNTSPQGAFVFHLHHDYMVEDRNQPTLDHWELTPGLSYGITDQLMFDVHGHFAKFGNGHLLPDHNTKFLPLGPSPFIEAMAFALQYQITQDAPIGLGFSLLYEEPMNRSIELLGGERVFAATLIVNKSFSGNQSLLLNLSAEIDGDESGYRYGLGFRSPLTPDAHGIAAGVELLGDFEGDVSILPGIYFPLGMQDIVFKTGLEFNREGASRSNLTLMYRF